MSNRLNIGNFLPSYPEQDDKDFNSKVWSKAEFRELVPPLFENPPKKGDAYIHQVYGTRFFSTFDRNIRLDEPGTGKSCIIVHSAELFKRNFRESFSIPMGKKRTTIRKAFILVKNQVLEANIYEQIVSKCTIGVYDTPEILRNLKDIKGADRAIKKEVHKWYEILTYSAFAKRVCQMEDSHLEEYMSDIAIYVDEAHYTVGSDKEAFNGELAAEDKNTYTQLHRAFHMGKRNKIMLLTGTPMINEARQIIPLMNLILPKNKQMSQTEERLFKTTPFEELLHILEPFFRGIVSYIRRPLIEIQEKYEGHLLQDLKFPLEIVDMAQLQWDVYKNQTEEEFALKRRSISNFIFPDGSFGNEGYRTFIHEENRDIGIFKVNRDTTYKFDEIMRHPQPDEDDQKLSLLNYSPKFVRMLQICDNIWEYPKENKAERGVIFVFFPHFEKGSGANLFSILLENNGYERYRSKTSSFSRRGNTKYISLRPMRRFVLISGSTDKKIIDYAMEILHSDENRYGDYIQVVIGTKVLRDGVSIDNGCAVIFSSPPWNYSSFIQARDRIFRATSHTTKLEELRKEAIEQGKDPSTVSIPVKIFCMAAFRKTNVYINEKDYTLYNYESPEGYLIEITENGKYVTPDGKSFEEGPLVELNQRDRLHKVYYLDRKPYLAILSRSRSLKRGDPENNGDMVYSYEIESGHFVENTVMETQEVRLYRRIQEKNDLIQKIFNIMRTVAVDCINTKIRNTRPDDVVELKCWNTLPDLPIDNSGKYCNYTDKFMGDIIESIRKVFYKDTHMSIHKITQSIMKDPVLVSIALHEMISKSSRYPIIDIFGRKQYLKKSSNEIYFLDNDPFTFSTSSETAYYSKSLSLHQDHKMDLLEAFNRDYSSMSVLELGEKIVSLSCSELCQWFTTLNIIDKVRVYEQLKQRQVDEQASNDFMDFVFKYMKDDSYDIHEPINSLSQISSISVREGYNRGRKATIARVFKKKSAPLLKELSRLEIDKEDGEREKVYIHKILFFIKEMNSTYSSSRDRISGESLRIYKPSEGLGFRTVNRSEADVYMTMINREIEKKNQEYREKYPIYGIINKKGEFRIANQTRETKKSKDKKDARDRFTGRLCMNWLVFDLLELLAYLKVEVLDKASYEKAKKLDPEDIRTLLKRSHPDIRLDHLDDDMIARLYVWVGSRRLGKKDMCNMILNSMIEKEMILYTSSEIDLN